MSHTGFSRRLGYVGDRKDRVYLAKEIPRARLVTVANAAHLPNLEHPDEFNAIVNEFLTAML